MRNLTCTIISRDNFVLLSVLLSIAFFLLSGGSWTTGKVTHPHWAETEVTRYLIETFFWDKRQSLESRSYLQKLWEWKYCYMLLTRHRVWADIEFIGCLLLLTADEYSIFVTLCNLQIIAAFSKSPLCSFFMYSLLVTAISNGYSVCYFHAQWLLSTVAPLV
jgi:hypothetical protein